MTVTEAQYKDMVTFLKELGVRCRITRMECVDGVWVYDIKGENPYKDWADAKTKRLAEDALNREENWW